MIEPDVVFVKDKLAILEGVPLQTSSLGGILDILRSSLGNAVSHVMDRTAVNERISLDRYEVGKILYNYIQGVLDGTYPVFDPVLSQAESVNTVKALTRITSYSQDYVWYLMYELYQSAQALESGSSDVLKPTTNTLSITDNILYSSVATAAGDVVKNAATAIGISPQTLQIILAVAVLGGVVYVVSKMKKG